MSNKSRFARASELGLADDLTYRPRTGTGGAVRSANWPFQPDDLAKHECLLMKLHDAVFERPRIKRYAESGRRLAFNNDDLFRNYPELDA